MGNEQPQIARRSCLLDGSIIYSQTKGTKENVEKRQSFEKTEEWLKRMNCPLPQTNMEVVHFNFPSTLAWFPMP